MKKRVVSVLLAAAMITTMLAGCSGKSGDSGDSPKKEAGAPEDGEIVELVMQWPSFGFIGEGFQDVEDALNELLEKDVGTHVTLAPVGLQESQNEAILQVSAGEQLDIILTASGGVGPLVDKGLILPLDDMIEEYGPDCIEHCGEQLKLGMYGGELYAVPTGPDALGRGFGYTLKKEFADKYNIAPPEEGKVYTMEEMEAIFDTIKAGEAEETYCVEPWNTYVTPLNDAYMAFDMPGGSPAAGVLMFRDGAFETTIENLFETEEYEEYCNRMYEWAQKGYIAPDAAVSTEAAGSKMNYDNYIGNFEYYHCPELVASETGREAYSYMTVAPYVAGSGGTTTLWSVANTSEYPEKALETINYLFKNPESAWILQYGLEGVNYEVVEDDGEHKVIRYLYDTVNDWQSMPYAQPYGLYGDRRDTLVIEPGPVNSAEIRQALSDSIPEERYSPAYGYSFNSDSVSAELAAVSTVIEKYALTLNCGAADPETTLAAFREELKAAGIDKLIGENQKQLDEWLASQK